MIKPGTMFLPQVLHSVGILKSKNTKPNLKILKFGYVKLDRNTKRLVYYSPGNSKECLPSDFLKFAEVQGGLEESVLPSLLFIGFWCVFCTP